MRRRTPGEEGLEEAARVIETALRLVVAASGAAVVGGAVLIMLSMDVASSSAGGRFYVAVGAAVLLLLLSDQYRRAMSRHRSTAAGETMYRRHMVRSGVLLLVSILGLFALALLLP